MMTLKERIEHARAIRQRAKRTQNFRAEFARLRETRNAMTRAGIDPRVVSGSTMGEILAEALRKGVATTHA